MKNKITAAALFTTLLPISVFASDWYVAPNGSDSNPGTLAAPFASIMAAQSAGSDGDTVYLRGGIYHLKNADIKVTGQTNAIVNDITKNGISYVNYSNELPIFDFSAVVPADRRVVAFRVISNRNVFKGFEIIGMRITITDRLTQSEAFRVEGGSNNLFEKLAIHDGMAIGWYLVSGSNNLVRNVDAYRNKGLNSFSYGNIDGFGVHPKNATDSGNVIEGSRAWFNSDDGFDLIGASAAVTLKNNWSFNNGSDSDFFKPLGDGNGFKAGGYGSNGSAYPRPVPRHVIRFNLAVNNRSNGFYANHHIGGQDWLNNTAIGNGRANYDMLSTLRDNMTDVPGYDHYLANNVGYGARKEIVNLGAATANLIARNSFTIPLQLTAKDFVSLDERQLTRPRQRNGDLPVITFATPSPNSALIDSGSDVGGPFNGKAPDLGAFESP
ncbi:right-handed parallel beta-helix repeat-containing protein [Pseudomonas viridiflava]|uniref:Right-handed parallel beta-helix repeat-containing protein n=1 Tax=Pseudomonas viridiflava TaxID=33069 RepID=A0ABU7N0T1_PSEVI|nr:right-handed parallel beta-helix repeat-containing protein [Pseudomonas viridiflava]MCJ8176632.1 right-handed parallel beta-helix repeat-containing protein [Pseudomonas viridiflava]MEE3934208.1 right-handed parallel beta-helix repeat-containing protein [Pseudomonas viridiflava]MEE4038535.1 right-handed parallel beta-helix repeat-containing protein [Pseudomonas viridiflava]MEE4058517.1 right-handed parallel beta-helix repeat-containing protein [Pseudomonas viridiflava]MEE4167564.1 right-hand